MLSFPFLSHIEFKCDATDIYVMFRNLCLCEGSNGFIVIYCDLIKYKAMRTDDLLSYTGNMSEGAKRVC
jgi:hypothetical protein